MDIASRTKWYLKNLLHCKDNGWVLITHEYMKTHFEELQKEVTPSLFSSWEIRPFTLEELTDVEQYFIPDSIFDSIENQSGSRTEMLSRLFAEDFETLYSCLDHIFEIIISNHKREKIDAVLHILEPFKCLKDIARKYDAKLINYSFSAIRRPHGYQQTLYNVCEDTYWSGKEASKRYDRFIEENNDSCPIFSNEEILAIIGKERNLPLLKLIDAKPQYELGVCCECYSLLPSVYQNFRYTDDDIFYTVKKLFGLKSIKVRSHSLHLDDLQVDRTVVHNDPASTLLSCKRNVAVQSQILLKSLLWKRPTVLRNDVLSFSFLCNSDFQSLKVADIKGLNYYIWGYLVPSDLLFTDEYLRWRLGNPTETEIYLRHLRHIFDALHIPSSILKEEDSKERYVHILQARSNNKALIDNLSNKEYVPNVNWDCVSSRFEVMDGNIKRHYWSIDILEDDGSLCTELQTEGDNITQIDFYPLDDVAGFASLEKVEINGQSISVINDGFKYMPKNTGHFTFKIPISQKTLSIKCKWNYKKINELLNK